MDRLLYIAMTGAKEATLHQASASNNLANVNATAFKADLAQARAMPIFGNGHPSRAFVMTEKPGTDWKQGSLIATGNTLDVAIDGKGFLAVQDKNGREAYTRFGELTTNGNNVLQTATGHTVMGNGGPITIPPYDMLLVADDGTISIREVGAPLTAITVVDRLKLVNPPQVDMKKGEDGLFRQNSGAIAAADPLVKVKAGFLESSNVNAVGEMIDIITLARQFEVQVKMMKNAEENDAALERLVQV
jgi:flagellar basal-body rod protein FlgF